MTSENTDVADVGSQDRPLPLPQHDETINEDEQETIRMEYEETVMYGRYSRDLGDFARHESTRIKALERVRRRQRHLQRKQLLTYRGKWQRRLFKVLSFVWKRSFARIGEDWVFLAIMGVLMALLSFTMDYGISMCNKARIWLYRDLTTHPLLQYMAWVTLPVGLILFSAGFVHIVSKSAVGSGIPEMKTILRGVPLDEYLTLRTLVAKVVGLTACLGSGMPLGKEGPFVHIASIVATLLTKLVTSFKGIYENESRNSEMLASACAVGVACSFAAPIGGVLFSIEVTSVYFAVRNYWRAFFAAVCSAMVFRLLAVWFNDEETITALFKTNFKVDFPFDPSELFVFAMIGVACGLGGALFVWLHRRYVVFMRNNTCMKNFLKQNRYLYPFIVSLFISSTTFPLGLGQFLAADLTTHDQVEELFSNFTWSSQQLEVDEAAVVDHWTNPYASFYVNLCVYICSTFCMAVVASTLPVPSGIFIPVFKMGAAFGRLVGECMTMWFPAGVRYGGHLSNILPGGYSIVGAAAFAGAVTHTISTSVIVFELTGQITHILPVMIAVLIANGISQLLQPSIYDSIIQIKRLPYLPDILTSNNAYSMFVEDIMVRDIRYIWHGMTYDQLKQILLDNRKLSTLPLVDSHESMVLLGSVKRKQLVLLLEYHLNSDRRLEVINRWRLAAHKARLSRHSGDWRQLVGLACTERSQRLLQQHIAANSTSGSRRHLATDVARSSDIDSDQDGEGDDDLIVVSGARLAPAHDEIDKSEAAPDTTDSGGFMVDKDPSAAAHGDEIKIVPARSVKLASRRLSRFAITPVVAADGTAGATSPVDDGQSSLKEDTTQDNIDQSAFEDDQSAHTDNQSAVDANEEDMTVAASGSDTSNSTRRIDSLPTPNGSSEGSPKRPRTSTLPAHFESANEKEKRQTLSVTNLAERSGNAATSTPLKSILKKENSSPTVRSKRAATIHSRPSSWLSPCGLYATVSGTESTRFRAAFDRVLQRTLGLKEMTRVTHLDQQDLGRGIKDEELFEHQKRWEERELHKPVKFNNCKIDPAPFQLVERTSLLKVHSLFSMLGLNHAYVTAIGRLIGVVALKELRQGIQRANNFAMHEHRDKDATSDHHQSGTTCNEDIATRGRNSDQEVHASFKV